LGTKSVPARGGLLPGFAEMIRIALDYFNKFRKIRK